MALSLEAFGFRAEETVDWIVGTPHALFGDDMESGTGRWNENDGTWGLTTGEAHSPTHSYTDSPAGPYGSYADTWIELAEPLDLSEQAVARLSFWHRFSTAGTGDPCSVEVSGDGGETWSRLSPSFYGTTAEWCAAEMPLTGLGGSPAFKVRFRLQSDDATEFDGWYVDDVAVLGRAPGNAVPTAPSPLSPVRTALAAAGLTLVAGNSTDADAGGALTYGFALYRDELLLDLVESVAGLPEGDGATSWSPSAALDEGATYWWRAWSDDGTERSLLSEKTWFMIDNAVPPEPVEAAALLPPTPNPFRDDTRLFVDLPAAASASVRVYDTAGRLVRVLHDGPTGGGRTAVSWDGTDTSGASVASGLYLARLETGGAVRHQKMVVLR